MRPETEDGRPLTSGEGAVDYVRTGLLGFLGPGGLVFVCGSRDGLMTVRITEKYLLTPQKYLTQVSGRKHNTDDIIATVLAVEPMRFIYRGRIAVFSVKVSCDWWRRSRDLMLTSDWPTRWSGTPSTPRSSFPAPRSKPSTSGTKTYLVRKIMNKE